jgi:hypothetical protein
MRIPHGCFAVLLCLAGACGGERSSRDADAPAANADPATTTYAACMAAANQQPSRAESVMKASECMRLPDAPPPGSTLPPGTPPPPIGAFADADTGAISSVYTSLAAADCRVTATDEESESSSSRCPGVAGYELNVHEGDLRMSIDVITPDGREHPLNYWSVISSGFSSLGPRAEWRMRGGRPIALIVRMNASEDPEDSSRITSYLAVAKITPSAICVTDRVPPSADANEAARRAADQSAARPGKTDA